MSGSAVDTNCTRPKGPNQKSSCVMAGWRATRREWGRFNLAKGRCRSRPYLIVDVRAIVQLAFHSNSPSQSRILFSYSAAKPRQFFTASWPARRPTRWSRLSIYETCWCGCRATHRHRKARPHPRQHVPSQRAIEGFWWPLGAPRARLACTAR
jgi:hypothetical protein